MSRKSKKILTENNYNQIRFTISEEHGKKGRYPLPNVEKELLSQLRDLYNSPANLKGLPESGLRPEYEQRRLRVSRRKKPEEGK